MDAEIKSTVDRDVLLVTFSGELNEKNVDSVVKRYFDVALGSGLKKILIDVRPLVGRLALGRTYFLIRKLPAPVPPDVKTALVEQKQFENNADFLETALDNIGIRVRYFLDYDKALEWLRSS